MILFKIRHIRVMRTISKFNGIPLLDIIKWQWNTINRKWDTYWVMDEEVNYEFK